MPFSRLLLRPLRDISLATWDLSPLSQHHCIKDMLPMKIYPYLSDRRKINETDVKYVETRAICRKYGTALLDSLSWIEVFLKEVLGLLAYE